MSPVKRSRKKPPAAVGLPRCEDDDVIGPGSSVMLPDGRMAAVKEVWGTDAYVVEWTAKFPRSWTIPISQLVAV